MAKGTYRPPQWKQPQLTSITVTQSTTVPSTGTITIGGAEGEPGAETVPGVQQGSVTATGGSTTYFFDAVLSVDHYTSRRFTEHPIQSGASVVDHSYQMPDRVILEVAFSDTMDSYQSGQYSSSVNAYQTFVTIQKSGSQLQLATRLQQYPIMGIEEIRASDTNMTKFGAKFSVVLRQIIIASLSVTPTTSNRPDSSQTTNAGAEQPTVPDPSILSQHSVDANQLSINSDPILNSGAPNF